MTRESAPEGAPAVPPPGRTSREGSTAAADNTRSAFLKLDRYALIDIARAQRLTSSEMLLLLVLVLLADWRTAEWTGTQTELADESRMSRKTVPDALARLACQGLIEIIKPFGPKREGTVAVAVYGRLVVPEKRRSKQEARREAASSDAIQEPTNRAGTAPEPRRSREPIASSDAVSDALISTFAEPGGREALRKGGTNSRPRDCDELTGDGLDLEEDLAAQNANDAYVGVCSKCGAPAEWVTDDGEDRCMEHT